MRVQPIRNHKLTLNRTSILLLALATVGCNQGDNLSVPAVATTPPGTPTGYVYRPPWILQNRNLGSQLRQRIENREATRIAIMTSVPQVTPDLSRSPTPIIWPTPPPPPRGAIRSAGAGEIAEV